MGLVLPNLNEVSKKNKVIKKKPSLVARYNWGQPLSTETHYKDEWVDTGWIGFFHLDKVLSIAIEEGASDVHLTPEQDVCFTVLGDIEHHPEFFKPNEDIMSDLVKGLLNHSQRALYIKNSDYDCAYEIKFGPYKGRRLRVNIGRTFDEDFLVFRIINNKIPSLSALNVEKELVEWSKLPNGLFLICGPTGTGKSTTLASILRNLQKNYSKKIITIEKPIEYVYPKDGKALVVQREVGIDCLSFYNGLTATARENADIILIGEVRDSEEVGQLLRAAEMAHLAISTMHTNSVATTLNRIQALFSGTDRNRILSQLGDTLRGLANQVLVKSIDGQSVSAVREILTIDENTRKFIQTGDVQGLRDYQFAHKITMEDNLVKAIKARRCTFAEGRSKSPFPDVFDKIAKREGLI